MGNWEEKMKKRIKALLSVVLMVTLLVGIFEPISANAKVVRSTFNDKFIKYAKPGDELEFYNGSSVPGVIAYLKYGTQVSEVDDGSKLVRREIYQGFGDYIPATCDPKLYDFYDPFLDYKEEGLTDWLLVVKNNDYTAIVYAIPVKASDVNPAYVENVSYTANDKFVTFSVSSNDI